MEITFNPFEFRGEVVSSREHFIGRKDAKRRLQNLVTSSTHCNYALFGERKIGKSSIAHQVFLHKDLNLKEKDIYPIEVNISTFSDAKNLFHSFVKKSYKAISKNKEYVKRLKPLLKKVNKNKNGIWPDFLDEIKDFFECVNDLNIKVILILDEFDGVRKIFDKKGSNRSGLSTQYFQGLRDLGYVPDYRVSFLIISRREIVSLEKLCYATSTLHGLFDANSIYLPPFGQKDYESFLSNFDKIGIKLNEVEKKEIGFYCGNHPYLLNVLCSEVLFNYSKKSKLEIHESFNNVSQSFMNHFNELKRLFNEKEAKTYRYLLRCLFGPDAHNLPKLQIDRLQKYGIIKKQHGGLVAFSEYFQNYLYQQGQKDDFWTIWTETENILRKSIALVFQNRFGEKWQLEFKIRHRDIFSSAVYRKGEERSEGELLSFLKPKELFEVILNPLNNTLFMPIIGNDLGNENFKTDIGLIMKVRTPIIFNRQQSPRPVDIESAELFCRNLKSKLLEYVNQNAY